MAARPTSGAFEIRPFRAEDYRGLLRGGTPPCISIYLPTHRKHPDWKQDPVRFRSLLSEAESLLGTGGVRDPKGVTEPLRALLDQPYWEHALDGLAVFLSGGSMIGFRLPMPVPERVVVADTYHTKPLLRFLHANRRYFVLSVSQNDVTLYEGSSFGAGAVDLAGVPTSLRDALGAPIHDRVMTVYGGGGGASTIQSRGPGREEAKEELLKYFRAVDKSLRDYLRDETAPLLLAAVGYCHPIYREANTYPHLLPNGIEGNFERSNGERIHAAAWPIVTAHFDVEIAAWRDRYDAAAGTGLASDRLEEVAAAAVAGRVRCLFAEEGATVWGMLDRANGEIMLHDRQLHDRDGDLVDDVAEEAVVRGAEVYLLPRDRMPSASPVAALYRF
ncbi:MAG TPA: hypothetical protein VLT84_00640 [Acidobacteriota bacterium]|nr:hypothetical protein [Acidobacteriota bacterium]